MLPLRFFSLFAASLLWIPFSNIALADDAPRLLFHASYDKAFSADTTKGKGNAIFSLGEVNYETLGAYLKPGIIGKAFHGGIMAEGDDAPRSRCIYSAKRNLNHRRGGLSFWVQPVDWGVRDKDFHIFFSAQSSKSLMMVYQFRDSTDLLFLVGPRNKGTDGKHQWTTTRASIKNWAPNDWHMLVCNWGPNTISLYVDGKHCDDSEVVAPISMPFDVFAVGEILGDTWKGTAGSSLIDEVKIYASPLGENGIMTEWEAHAPDNAELATDEPSTPKVRYVTTDLHRKIALAAIQYPANLEGAPSLNMKLTDPKTGTVVASVAQVPIKRAYMMELPIGDVPPGDYQLSVECSQDTFFHTIDYQIPTAPAPWVGNDIGKLNEVPAPWTDLRVEGEKIEIWGRSINLTNHLFPSQIRTQDQDLLAAPIRLVTGDTPLPIETVKGQQVTNSALAAVIETTARSGDLEVHTKTRVEYDGFMWITLTLTAKKPYQVPSLALEIPLRSRQATLVHELAKGYEHRQTTSGRLPDKGWKKNLFHKPIFWVGNEDVGLQWFAETLEGWSVHDENNSVEAARDTASDDMIVRLNLIDHPVTLKGTRTITFGLMPTPVKPRMKRWRNLRVDSNIVAWLPYTKLFNYPGRDQVLEDDPHVRLNLARTDGKPVTPYHALYTSTPLSPQWPYWSREWRLSPPAEGLRIDELRDDPKWLAVYVSAASENYRDFYLWKLNEGISAHGIKHLYFDHGVPRMDKNTEHGSGWIDERGRLRKSYNILGTRDLARRIYVMLKEHSPEGIILNHMSEEPAMPVLAYADVMIEGEIYCKQVPKDRSYYNAFSPDLFRSQFMSRQWGPISVFIPQFKRGSKVFDPGSMHFWDTPMGRKAVNHFIGYILVHDAKVWSRFGVDMTDIYQAQDKFGWDDSMRFIPYWDTESPFQRSGNYNKTSDGEQEIMISAYTKSSKAMIVVMNNTDQDETVEIAVDKFKFPPPFRHVSDALTSLPIENKGNLISVSIPAREYRMVLLK